MYLLGNSSAGIRETPVYGVPSINIGDRQLGRFYCSSIINAEIGCSSILKSINEAKCMAPLTPRFDFGEGNSAEMFLGVMTSAETWNVSRQKQFVDFNVGRIC